MKLRRPLPYLRWPRTILDARLRINQVAEVVAIVQTEEPFAILRAGPHWTPVSPRRCGGGKRAPYPNFQAELSSRSCHTVSAPVVMTRRSPDGSLAMNAGDRLAHEINLEDQRILEERRERTEQARKSAEATLNRRAAPSDGLVYRTTVKAEQAEKTVTVMPPQVSPQETQIWWQWTQAQIAHERSEIKKHIAHERSEIESELKYEIEILRDAVGEALGEKCQDVREDLRREIDFVKRELEQTQNKFNAQVELEREREALRVKAADAHLAKLETLCREMREGLQSELDFIKRELSTQSSLNTTPRSCATKLPSRGRPWRKTREMRCDAR